MAKRVYANDRIAVHWNSERCIHAAICLQRLPSVFDVRRRPWVEIDAADADSVAATVEQCPTGALTYERLDGAPGEQPGEETTMTVWPGGPLLVRGKLDIRLPDGTPVANETRVALCRCGQSRNQPFCDNTHRRIAFRNNPHIIPPNREQAEDPNDVSPEEGLP